MLKNLSYKKKNRILWVAILLLCFFIYSYNLSDTIKLIGEYSQMQKRSDLAYNAPTESIKLQKKLESINRNARTSINKTSSTEQELLEITSAYCQKNNIILREFPKTAFSDQKDLRIETHVFRVEGEFNKLLRLVYELEQKNKTGKLASVNFLSKKDLKTNRFVLSATVYVQNVMKIEGMTLAEKNQ